MIDKYQTNANKNQPTMIKIGFQTEKKKEFTCFGAEPSGGGAIKGGGGVEVSLLDVGGGGGNVTPGATSPAQERQQKKVEKSTNE